MKTDLILAPPEAPKALGVKDAKLFSDALNNLSWKVSNEQNTLDSVVKTARETYRKTVMEALDRYKAATIKATDEAFYKIRDEAIEPDPDGTAKV